MNGLYSGFNIGFVGSITSTEPNNLQSAIANPQGVTEAIQKELERGHISGPFLTPPFPILHCSPIGAVVKSDKSCRLVMDLSQPRGRSINEFISKEEFSVQYTHFDRATDLVQAMGKGCLMSKVDIKHAFRLLPVRARDWPLLGFRWDGAYFIDTRLPFGLRSSPGIFNKFADLLCWIFQVQFGLQQVIHYSDNFFLVSSKDM